GTATSLTASWNATSPAGDSYTFRVSTDTNFNGTISSSNTVSTSATASVPALTPNTTYYGQVNSVINGSSSPYSANVTTATLAVVPNTAVSTWTVNITSLTVTWTNGSNPASVTKYIVELSTVSGFGSGQTLSSTT